MDIILCEFLRQPFRIVTQQALQLTVGRTIRGDDP